MSILRTTCLITGCALRLEHSTDRAWGDLHLQGDRFIFNGVVDKTGSLVWARSIAQAAEKALVLPVGEEYFERRGVLICRAGRDLLNEAARAHIEKWWRP